MDCGVIWGGIFFGQDGQSEEAPYDGFLMFDTHTAFGDRNEDNGALVVGAPVLGNSYFPKPDWARGTATPSGAEDGPPEDYVYVNAGSCLGMKGTSGRTVLSPEDDTPQRTESCSPSSEIFRTSAALPSAKRRMRSPTCGRHPGC